MIGDDAVAAETEGVDAKDHPLGHPIRDSTKLGLSTLRKASGFFDGGGELGILLEVDAPSVGLSGAGRPGADSSVDVAPRGWAVSSQARITSVSDSPGCITPVVVVDLALALASRVFGVGHVSLSLKSDGFPRAYFRADPASAFVGVGQFAASFES